MLGSGVRGGRAPAEGVVPAAGQPGGGVRVLIAAVAAVVFALDLLSKRWVTTHLAPGASLPVIPGIFYLTYIRNSGAAFGLLQGQTVLFLVITAAVVVLILTYGRRAARGVPLLGIAFGLQLGGALGNLLDRLLYARVTDFLDFKVWPFIFNLADAAIVVGGGLFALVVFREPAEGPGAGGGPSDARARAASGGRTRAQDEGSPG
jgi:signal peptidase II